MPRSKMRRASEQYPAKPRCRVSSLRKRGVAGNLRKTRQILLSLCGRQMIVQSPAPKRVIAERLGGRLAVCLDLLHERSRRRDCVGKARRERTGMKDHGVPRVVAMHRGGPNLKRPGK